MRQIPDRDIVGVMQDGTVFGITVGAYPNGEPIIARHDDCKALLVRPTSMATFHAALFFIDALRWRGHASPTLILPCVPGQRQDRMNDMGDALFTAKSVAQAINLRECPRVVVVDPHSDVIPALIDRCVVAPVVDSLPRARYDGVIAPDAGAEKRAWKAATRLACPLIHAGKHRDLSTGEITDFWLQDAPPGHYLVVDDLCDGGGTFRGLATEIMKAGSTADLYVSHGLFTQGTKVVTEAYRTVYCTDSTVQAKFGITVLPLCRTLLEVYA